MWTDFARITSSKLESDLLKFRYFWESCLLSKILNLIQCIEIVNRERVKLTNKF